ncbi:hypothetical protein ACFE04_013724 [Oxalis oulophora]
MEHELKDLHNNSKSTAANPPSTTTTTTTSAVHEDASSKEDGRPLLKHPSPSPSAENLQDLEKKFGAYVRHDVYGPMGRGELPLEEKILLAIALVTNDEEDEQEDYAHVGGWRRKVIVWCGRFLARVVLFVFGFYWIKEAYRIPSNNNKNESKGQSEESERPGAIISNHVSYVDILYHMSASFASFVAKRSVAKLPLIGIISKCLGCVYVQRESKSSDFKGVSGIVTERVQEAHSDPCAPMMMLFPEGTTTNGDYLLPFKTGAFLARSPVLPVILKFPYQRFSPAWDSISGIRHLILLLCQFVNHMEVTRLPIYYPSQEEKDDPKLYAANVRRLMATEGNLVMTDIGLAEKRIYHAALNVEIEDSCKFDCVMMTNLPLTEKIKLDILRGDLIHGFVVILFDPLTLPYFTLPLYALMIKVCMLVARGSTVSLSNCNQLAGYQFGQANKLIKLNLISKCNLFDVVAQALDYKPLRMSNNGIPLVHYTS